MDNIANILAALTIIVGIITAVIQMRQESKRKRSEFLIQLVNSIIDDNQIRDLIYEFDYDKFIYDEETFHQSDKEKAMDRLLAKYDTIGRLYYNGHIDKDDLDFISYEIKIIYSNSEFKKYWHHLTSLFESHGTTNKYENFKKNAEYLTK